MADRTTWLAFAERCEKAKGPDRDIDVEIEGGVMGWSVSDIAYCCLNDRAHNAPNCTGSIDAITALIARELPGWSIKSGSSQTYRCWSTVWSGSDLKIAADGKGASEALARSAALCRAKAALSDHQPRPRQEDTAHD